SSDLETLSAKMEKFLQAKALQAQAKEKQASTVESKEDDSKKQPTKESEMDTIAREAVLLAGQKAAARQDGEFSEPEDLSVQTIKAAIAGSSISAEEKAQLTEYTEKASKEIDKLSEAVAEITKQAAVDEAQALLNNDVFIILATKLLGKDAEQITAEDIVEAASQSLSDLENNYDKEASESKDETQNVNNLKRDIALYMIVAAARGELTGNAHMVVDAIQLYSEKFAQLDLNSKDITPQQAVELVAQASDFAADMVEIAYAANALDVSVIDAAYGLLNMVAQKVAEALVKLAISFNDKGVSHAVLAVQELRKSSQRIMSTAVITGDRNIIVAAAKGAMKVALTLSKGLAKRSQTILSQLIKKFMKDDKSLTELQAENKALIEIAKIQREIVGIVVDAVKEAVAGLDLNVEGNFKTIVKVFQEAAKALLTQMLDQIDSMQIELSGERGEEQFNKVQEALGTEVVRGHMQALEAVADKGSPELLAAAAAASVKQFAQVADRIEQRATRDSKEKMTAYDVTTYNRVIASLIQTKILGKRNGVDLELDKTITEMKKKFVFDVLKKFAQDQNMLGTNQNIYDITDTNAKKLFASLKAIIDIPSKTRIEKMDETLNFIDSMLVAASEMDAKGINLSDRSKSLKNSPVFKDLLKPSFAYFIELTNGFDLDQRQALTPREKRMLREVANKWRSTETMLAGENFKTTVAEILGEKKVELGAKFRSQVLDHSDYQPDTTKFKPTVTVTFDEEGNAKSTIEYLGIDWVSEGDLTMYTPVENEKSGKLDRVNAHKVRQQEELSKLDAEKAKTEADTGKSKPKVTPESKEERPKIKDTELNAFKVKRQATLRIGDTEITRNVDVYITHITPAGKGEYFALGYVKEGILPNFARKTQGSKEEDKEEESLLTATQGRLFTDEMAEAGLYAKNVKINSAGYASFIEGEAGQVPVHLRPGRNGGLFIYPLVNGAVNVRMDTSAYLKQDGKFAGLTAVYNIVDGKALVKYLAGDREIKVGAKETLYKDKEAKTGFGKFWNRLRGKKEKIKGAEFEFRNVNGIVMPLQPKPLTQGEIVKLRGYSASAAYTSITAWNNIDGDTAMFEGTDTFADKRGIILTNKHRESIMLLNDSMIQLKENKDSKDYTIKYAKALALDDYATRSLTPRLLFTSLQQQEAIARDKQEQQLEGTETDEAKKKAAASLRAEQPVVSEVEPSEARQSQPNMIAVEGDESGIKMIMRGSIFTIHEDSFAIETSDAIVNVGEKSPVTIYNLTLKQNQMAHIDVTDGSLKIVMPRFRPLSLLQPGSGVEAEQVKEAAAAAKAKTKTLAATDPPKQTETGDVSVPAQDQSTPETAGDVTPGTTDTTKTAAMTPAATDPSAVTADKGKQSTEASGKATETSKSPATERPSPLAGSLTVKAFQQAVTNLAYKLTPADGGVVNVTVETDRVLEAGNHIRITRTIAGQERTFIIDKKFIDAEFSAQHMADLMVTAVKARGEDLYTGLDSKEYIMAVVDRSSTLFGDHKQNHFMYVNASVLKEIGDRKIQNMLLMAGFSHELRHEAGADNEALLTAEDAALTMKMLSSTDVTKADYITALSGISAGAYSESLKASKLVLTAGLTKSIDGQISEQTRVVIEKDVRVYFDHWDQTKLKGSYIIQDGKNIAIIGLYKSSATGNMIIITEDDRHSVTKKDPPPPGGDEKSDICRYTKYTELSVDGKTHVLDGTLEYSLDEKTGNFNHMAFNAGAIKLEQNVTVTLLDGTKATADAAVEMLYTGKEWMLNNGQEIKIGGKAYLTVIGIAVPTDTVLITKKIEGDIKTWPTQIKKLIDSGNLTVSNGVKAIITEASKDPKGISWESIKAAVTARIDKTKATALEGDERTKLINGLDDMLSALIVYSVIDKKQDKNFDCDDYAYLGSTLADKMGLDWGVVYVDGLKDKHVANINVVTGRVIDVAVVGDFKYMLRPLLDRYTKASDDISKVEIVGIVDGKQKRVNLSNWDKRGKVVTSGEKIQGFSAEGMYYTEMANEALDVGNTAQAREYAIKAYAVYASGGAPVVMPMVARGLSGLLYNLGLEALKADPLDLKAKESALGFLKMSAKVSDPVKKAQAQGVIDKIANADGTFKTFTIKKNPGGGITIISEGEIAKFSKVDSFYINPLSRDAKLRDLRNKIPAVLAQFNKAHI
ncbi:hypothetical protein ACFL0T_08140, partial [Candidatus Omnitrophota bacterium]